MKLNRLARDTRKTRKDKRGVSLYFVILLLLLHLVGTAAAGDEPFDRPANWGGTGLMEIPTARVMRQGRFRVGASQIDPYRYYYLAVSPLEGLEIDGHLTEVIGVAAMQASYGDTKDKAIDLKYRILPEGKWWPAFAVGIMDPHGTRVYPAQYLVASKQIYPFDFTIGFGNGRFGKQVLPRQGEGIAVEMFTDNTSWRRDGQFFGGVQFALSEEVMLMAEYNPIRYEVQIGDPAVSSGKYFTEPVPSKYNFGVRWRPLNWLEADLSWQRGNQIGVNLSAAFDLGVPMIPLYDQPYREKPEHRMSSAEERIARGLEATGFSDIIVRKNGDELAVEARNGKYYYTPRALSVMLRVVAELAPADVKEIRLIISNNGIPIVAMTTTREGAGLFLADKLTTAEFLGLNRELSPFNTDITEGLPGKKLNREWWSYGLKPDFQMYLESREGFFKYRAGGSGWLSLYPWKGSTFITGLQLHPLNNIPVENVEADALQVRGDVALYKSQSAALSMLMYDQIHKFQKEIYGRISVGFLEIQYAGLDGEIARPFFGGRLMLGLSGSVVKKRDPVRALGLKENDFRDRYETAFFNTRLNIPEVEAAIDLKMGQFLAGDRGTRITLSKFFNGVVLSAWYSETNTDIFSDPWNRGYHDKGVSVTIPVRLFGGTDSKTIYGLGISSWTRDVAQDIEHFNTLFDYIGRNTDAYLKKDALSRDYRNAGFK